MKREIHRDEEENEIREVKRRGRKIEECYCFSQIHFGP